MRIKELDDILKLVERMPADRQMYCVKALMQEVEMWEDRESFTGTDWEYVAEVVRQGKARREQWKQDFAERRAAALKRRKPPG